MDERKATGVKLYKAAALLLLVLATAAVVMAFLASNRRVDIQGPSAIAVLPDGGVWLSVEDALWRFDAQGKRLAVVPPARHGVHGLIANLVVHPGGDLVASIRDDPALYFLDPVTAAPRRQITPRWPADLERHGARAITYDFHPDGRLAISTGGGHAVALFDPTGGFLARTSPGLYEFSNGLWFSGESLWTTDTNRFTLIELDGRTLAVKSRVALRGSVSGWRFLGMAAGAPATGGPADRPLGTVVRFANGMVEGHAVDVLPTGQQRPYPTAHGAALEPRDIKWRAGELLLVDGASYAIKRYSAQRLPLPDFGEAAARTQLADLLLLRESLQMRYYAGLAMAIALFIGGAFLAWRAQGVEKAQRMAALGIDLSQLGTARLTESERVRAMFGMVWPVLLCAALVLLHPLLPMDAGWFGLDRQQAAALIMVVLGVITALAIFRTWRTMRRASRDPRMDALLNQPAVAAISGSDVFWRMRDPGELPREALFLAGASGGRQLLVLTNQRLLVFAANLRDFSLKHEYARREVMKAAVLEPGEMQWRQRLAAVLSGGRWLRLQLRDGSVLEGLVAAPQTAARMAALLRGVATEPPTLAQFKRVAAEVPGLVRDETRAKLQALASFVIPGLGQWMQARGATALLMFVPWLVVVLAVATPLVWTLWGPRAAVRTPFVIQLAAAYLVICSLSALDAWRMRRAAD
jgi:hypothetical protein